MLIAPEGICAWKETAPGFYMDNYSQKGKVIKGSYKYTLDYPPFKADMNTIPEAQKLKIYAYTQDVILDCETKKVRMTNMTYYNKEGKVVMKVPEDISGNVDPDMLKSCKQAGLL